MQVFIALCHRHPHFPSNTIRKIAILMSCRETNSFAKIHLGVQESLLCPVYWQRTKHCSGSLNSCSHKLNRETAVLSNNFGCSLCFDVSYNMTFPSLSFDLYFFSFKVMTTITQICFQAHFKSDWLFCLFSLVLTSLRCNISDVYGVVTALISLHWWFHQLQACCMHSS